MTPPNPFIELAQDPVTTLAVAAYVVALLALSSAGALFVIREATHLYATAQRAHRQRDWWGDFGDGWCPPPGWSLRFLRAAFVAVAGLLALSALAWVAGVGV